MITREKCLELAREADPSFGNEKVVLSDSICGSDRIESLVRASVCLGLEMAAKECEALYTNEDMCEYWLEYSAKNIRKLAEEVQRG